MCATSYSLGHVACCRPHVNLESLELNTLPKCILVYLICGGCALSILLSSDHQVVLLYVALTSARIRKFWSEFDQMNIVKFLNKDRLATTPSF